MSFISHGVLTARSEPGTTGGVIAVFKYNVGDAIPSSSFSRASTATYITNTGLIGQVNADVPRDQHYIAGQQYLLLEPSRTNQFPWSEPVANWPVQGAVVSSPTITAVSQSDPRGINGVLYRMNFPAVTGSGAYSQFYNQYITGTSLVMSVWLEGVSGSETPHLIGRRNDGTYASTRLSLTTSWKNYQVSIGSSTVSTGCSIGVDLRDAVETVTTPMSMFGYGKQVEDGGYATSLIHTTGSVAARQLDVYSFTTPGGAGQVGTLYEKYYDLATNISKETVTPYTTLSTYTPNVGRAWISWKFALGTQTLGTMQGI